MISSEEESKAIREKLTKGKRVRFKKSEPPVANGCSTCGSDSPCGSSEGTTTYAQYLTVENVLIASACVGALGLAYATFARTRN